jgi:hypothetical protein
MENAEARLAALELAVTELRTQLDHERTRIRTMQRTHTCPSCGGTRILHFRRVEEVGDAGPVPLSLDNRYSMWREKVVELAPPDPGRPASEPYR